MSIISVRTHKFWMKSATSFTLMNNKENSNHKIRSNVFFILSMTTTRVTDRMHHRRQRLGKDRWCCIAIPERMEINWGGTPPCFYMNSEQKVLAFKTKSKFWIENILIVANKELLSDVRVVYTIVIFGAIKFRGAAIVEVAEFSCKIWADAEDIGMDDNVIIEVLTCIACGYFCTRNRTSIASASTFRRIASWALHRSTSFVSIAGAGFWPNGIQHFVYYTVWPFG